VLEARLRLHRTSYSIIRNSMPVDLKSMYFQFFSIKVYASSIGYTSSDANSGVTKQTKSKVEVKTIR